MMNCAFAVCALTRVSLKSLTLRDHVQVSSSRSCNTVIVKKRRIAHTDYSDHDQRLSVRCNVRPCVQLPCRTNFFLLRKKQRNVQ